MLEPPSAPPVRHPPNLRWRTDPRLHPDVLGCETREEARSGAALRTTSTAGPIATAPSPERAASPLGCRPVKNPAAIHCESRRDERAVSDSIPREQAELTTCSEIGTPHTPSAETIHSRCSPAIAVRDRPCLAADHPPGYRAATGVPAA